MRAKCKELKDSGKKPPPVAPWTKSDEAELQKAKSNHVKLEDTELGRAREAKKKRQKQQLMDIVQEWNDPEAINVIVEQASSQTQSTEPTTDSDDSTIAALPPWKDI